MSACAIENEVPVSAESRYSSSLSMAVIGKTESHRVLVPPAFSILSASGVLCQLIICSTKKK